MSSEADLKKTGRGSSDSKVEVNSGIVAVGWYDNRTVDLVSSHVGVEPVSTVVRYDKKQKKNITVPCPEIIKVYNKFMGGVDLHDSLTALYRFPIKSKVHVHILLHFKHDGCECLAALSEPCSGVES